MTEATPLDRTFQVVMGQLIATGRAPHYTELATALGCSADEGRDALRALLASGYPGWVYPDTDYIASFAPFSTLPTQYRISVAGQQKWYGQ